MHRTHYPHQDVGNVVEFEHVNVAVPDFEMATWFYVGALGLTRDPYLELGPDLVWINVGAQQFHLLRGDPQVVRGVIELVVPSHAGLIERMRSMGDRVPAMSFAVDASRRTVTVEGPWGNRFRCLEAAPGARVQLGLTGVEYTVRPGAAAGIQRFYEQVLGARTSMDGDRCTVIVGPGQTLGFVESDDARATGDGDHLAIYVSDFSGTYERLEERGLLMSDDQACQYRFSSIVDPDDGTPLFEVEHEVRSLHHPLRGRPLVNRNPDQRPPSYVPGRDAFVPGDASEAALRAALDTVG